MDRQRGGFRVGRAAVVRPGVGGAGAAHDELAHGGGEVGRESAGDAHAAVGGRAVRRRVRRRRGVLCRGGGPR